MPGTKQLRDPAIGLDCTETPFYPPKTLSNSDLAICSSCKLVFSSEVIGPQQLTLVNSLCCAIDESPLVQLTYNNTTYGLANTFLWTQGIHRNFKAEKNYDMEMNLYFKDIYKPDNLIAVVIPITIDNAQARPYFNSIANGRQGNSQGVNIETLIEKESPVLVYKGIDLRGRNGDKKQTAQQCLSTTSNMTWLVFPTTFISKDNADLLKNTTANPKAGVPQSTIPAPDHEITLERARKMCMIIPKVELKKDLDNSRNAKRSENVFLTRALQCQRIDPSKDVRGDAVYLDSTTGNTLQNELDNVTNLNKSIDKKKKPYMRASDIENILALVVGITIGVICIALLSYGFYNLVFKKYVANLESMETAILTTPVPCKPPILF